MGNALTRALASVGLWASEESPEGAPDPMDPRFWGAISAASLAGQVVNELTTMQLDVVQAVMERLGGAISSLPMMVFERVGDGAKRPAPDHPLYDILHRKPNWRQTAQEHRDQQVRHLASWRNSYDLIHPAADGGPVGSLEQIDPSRCQRVAMGSDGHVYYTFRRLDSGQADTYRDDHVWHIRRAPLTVNGLCGKPVWETSRQTLGGALAVEEFGALYFKNGGNGGGVIKHPGNFRSTDDRDEFMRAWREQSTGLNRHKDRVLLFGAEYLPSTVHNDEAQFIETVKQKEIKVCRLWNMPPHMVGILDRATFSNIEQQSLEFVLYTIAPYITGLEQAASRDLLVGEDQKKYFIEINVAGLLRGDLKTRWQAFALGRQWGWLSVNDICRLENMDTIGPDGDRYLEPMNMSPVGIPGADEAVDEPAEPGRAPDPADNPNDPGNAK